MQKANKGTLPPFDASSYKVAIVVAQFNADITGQLLSSALAGAKQFRLPEKNVTVYRVAGSVEMPVVLKALAETKKYNALVALGTIIRGDTDHYDYVAKIVTEGVLAVMMQTGVPVGFGVLTCDTEKQARARGEFGAGALAAALQSARAMSEIADAK